MNHEDDFLIPEEELIVLMAFFLALPLPPVLANNNRSEGDKTEEVLKRATESIVKKGWISPHEDQLRGDRVEPELAGLLRDISYGNGLVHFFHHTRGEAALQTAYYYNKGQIVCQSLTGDGQHRIGRVGPDQVLADANSFLSNAPAGKMGAKAILPLDAWHYLLSSRVVGSGEEVVAELLASAEPTNDEQSQIRRQFATGLMSAPLVLEATCMYDRLREKGEKASFVIGEETNWLLIPAPSDSNQRSLWVFEANKQSLLQTMTGLLASISQTISEKSRAK